MNAPKLKKVRIRAFLVIDMIILNVNVVVYITPPSKQVSVATY